VDDALLVGGLERLGHLAGDRERLLEGDRAAPQALGEVLALGELHDEDALAFDPLDAEEGGDPGVGE
jgi:hypothetical protein